MNCGGPSLDDGGDSFFIAEPGAGIECVCHMECERIVKTGIQLEIVETGDGHAPLRNLGGGVGVTRDRPGAFVPLAFVNNNSMYPLITGAYGGGETRDPCTGL